MKAKDGLIKHSTTAKAALDTILNLMIGNKIVQVTEKEEAIMDMVANMVHHLVNTGMVCHLDSLFINITALHRWTLTFMGVLWVLRWIGNRNRLPLVE